VRFEVEQEPRRDHSEPFGEEEPVKFVWRLLPKQIDFGSALISLSERNSSRKI
jgi:hypothetical protein